MKTSYRFSKDWLLSLSSSPPDKRIEYKDTEIKYLRAVHHPSGKVKLSIYKCPTGQSKAVRVAIPFSVNHEMPSVQRIRSEANKILVQLDQGINPNDRKITTQSLTLQKALDNYLDGSNNTERVITNWRNSIESHLQKWLNTPLQELCSAKKLFATHRLIMNNISQHNNARGLSGDGGIGANEVMKKLRRILNFNRALDRSLNLPTWPAEELGNSGLKMWVEQKPRTRRIHREEFPIFWKALNNLVCPIQKSFFTFLLLTGCRSSEAKQLTVEDINLQRWTVTFKDTKNGLDHTLPLTETLKQLIQERICESADGRLFSLSEPKAITKHIKRKSGLHITPHDLRRTFAGVAEVAGIGSTIKKNLLNHLSGRDVTDDYTGYTDIDDLREALEGIEQKVMGFIDTRQKQHL